MLETKTAFSPEERKNAAAILLKNYLEHRERDPAKTCEKLGIEIRRDELLGKRDSRLNMPAEGRNWCAIFLPRKSESPELDTYLIYHELAHYFLLDDGIAHIPSKSFPGFWEEEAWCENFALAMFFYSMGGAVFPAEKSAEYFQKGAELGGDSFWESVRQRALTYCLDVKRELKGRRKESINARLAPLVRLANLLGPD
ncbi:MAG: hypothetical protein Q8Q97_02260 [bacterium]|nr:hypothetical protein [bacterium]